MVDEQGTNLHQDIYALKDTLRDEKTNKQNKAFSESSFEHCRRIAKEYDIIGDKEQTEKWLLY